MTTAPGSAKPWYREPLVWMLIAIPLSAVVGGFITLGLAITSDDGLVVDDYYKRGKEINRVLRRDHAAARQDLGGKLLIVPEKRILSLSLSARDTTRLPVKAHLKLLHATRSGFDQEVDLDRTPEGKYHGLLTRALAPGHWYLQVEADDWRLVGELHLPDDHSATLQPAVGAS